MALPLEALEIEQRIEALIEKRLEIKADRSLYRSFIDTCTDALKRLRDEIADLEEELAFILGRKRQLLIA